MTTRTRRATTAVIALMMVVLAGCPPQPAAWECDSVINAQERSAGFFPNTAEYQVCDAGPGVTHPSGNRTAIVGWVERHDDPPRMSLVFEEQFFAATEMTEQRRVRFVFSPAPQDGFLALGSYPLGVPGEQTTAFRSGFISAEGWPDTDFDWAIDGGTATGWLNLNALEIGEFDESDRATIEHLNADYRAIWPSNFTEWTAARVRIGRPSD